MYMMQLNMLSNTVRRVGYIALHSIVGWVAVRLCLLQLPAGYFLIFLFHKIKMGKTACDTGEDTSCSLIKMKIDFFSISNDIFLIC